MYGNWKQFNWEEILATPSTSRDCKAAVAARVSPFLGEPWKGKDRKKVSFSGFCITGIEVTEVRGLQGWAKKEMNKWEQTNKTGPDLFSELLPTPWANNDNPWEAGKTFFLFILITRAKRNKRINQHYKGELKETRRDYLFIYSFISSQRH